MHFSFHYLRHALHANFPLAEGKMRNVKRWAQAKIYICLNSFLSLSKKVFLDIYGKHREQEEGGVTKSNTLHIHTVPSHA